MRCRPKWRVLALIAGPAALGLAPGGCHETDPAAPVVPAEPAVVILDGTTDWSHPDDPEIYPYYVQLNDPTGVHHPFAAGARVPDRSYVVVKALARSVVRRQAEGDAFVLGIDGAVAGVRTDLSGGTFTFATGQSEAAFPPPWDALCDTCWYADTLGFLTGPGTAYTVTLRAVDGTGSADGAPASLGFTVGYAPCVQCIEVVPGNVSASAYGPGIPCADDAGAAPCFAETAVLRIGAALPPGTPDALPLTAPGCIVVDRTTFATTVSHDPPLGDDAYVIDARLHTLRIVLHGQDDPRERWDRPDRRIHAWRYRVDHACDPGNTLAEGGGVDDLAVPTWGEPMTGLGLRIDAPTGLWFVDVEIAVPTVLLTAGPTAYRTLLAVVHGAEVAPALFAATTRQLGDGSVAAVALDQTTCGVMPYRPARYHVFRAVRPAVATPGVGRTWRDCVLDVPGIQASLDLAAGAMQSDGGAPRVKSFRIVVETPEGAFTPDCSGR